MTKTILHIGYPKTATKWFQRIFYPSIARVYSPKRDLISDILIFPDYFSYKPEAVIEQLNNQSANSKIVICEELLLGGLDIAYGSGEFIVHIANRLKATFINADVVIFIRNQHSVLESAYSHYIKSGGTYSIKKYLGINGHFQHQFQNHYLFNPSFFNYFNTISLYVKVFGKENVHVFLYEDFIANPEQFIINYCNKFSLDTPEGVNFKVKENARLSSVSVKILRILNHFTSRNTPFKHYIFKWTGLYPYLISLSGLIDRNKILNSKPFTFDQPIHEWINEHYSQNNKTLGEYVDIDKLKEYGYPL